MSNQLGTLLPGHPPAAPATRLPRMPAPDHASQSMCGPRERCPHDKFSSRLHQHSTAHHRPGAALDGTLPGATRTDQQHVTPAVGNLFEAKPGPATFFASAYMPVLQHLREGSHTVVSDAVLPDGPRTSAAPYQHSAVAVRERAGTVPRLRPMWVKPSVPSACAATMSAPVTQLLVQPVRGRIVKHLLLDSQPSPTITTSGVSLSLGAPRGTGHGPGRRRPTRRSCTE
jgi:hypothetical protein